MNGNWNKPYSYELLVAYVDGQLNHGEREYLLMLMAQDEDLNRRVSALRNVSDMVRLAYAHAEPRLADLPQHCGRRRGLLRKPWWLAAAVFALIAIAGRPVYQQAEQMLASSAPSAHVEAPAVDMSRLMMHRASSQAPSPQR